MRSGIVITPTSPTRRRCIESGCTTPDGSDPNTWRQAFRARPSSLVARDRLFTGTTINHLPGATSIEVRSRALHTAKRELAGGGRIGDVWLPVRPGSFRRFATCRY